MRNFRFLKNRVQYISDGLKKQAPRHLFGLSGGKHLIVFSDKNDIVLIPKEAFLSRIKTAMEMDQA